MSEKASWRGGQSNQKENKVEVVSDCHQRPTVRINGRMAWRGGRWKEGAPTSLLFSCCAVAYFFRFDATQNKQTCGAVSFPMSAAPWKTVKKKRRLMRGRRTRCALRGRLAFPPYVLIVDIDIVVVVLFSVIIIVFVVLAPAAVVIALHPRGGVASRFLSRRRRRCGRHPCRCVADGCAWMAYAIRAEPLAVWDVCQGRREARVVIRFIALRARL